MRAAAVPLWLLAALAPLCAGAASLDVSPIRIELTGKKPNALLTLKNSGEAPARFQFRVYSWDESPAGDMILADSTELSVFPALQQLGPREERKVRIGTTVKPGAKERTWRIFIEELPSAVEAEDRTKVRVLTRIGIPIFLEPVKPASGGELVLTRDGAKLRLRVRNTGTVRFQPTELKLVLLGEKDERIEEKALSPWYVLADADRLYAMEVQPETCARARRAVASATLEKGSLQAVLELPAGACAP
jgi:fimbrial chaperone protein